MERKLMELSRRFLSSFLFFFAFSIFFFLITILISFLPYYIGRYGFEKKIGGKRVVFVVESFFDTSAVCV